MTNFPPSLALVRKPWIRLAEARARPAGTAPFNWDRAGLQHARLVDTLAMLCAEVVTVVLPAEPETVLVDEFAAGLERAVRLPRSWHTYWASLPHPRTV